MQWESLQRLWVTSGHRDNLKVRFNDWSHQTKYFVIKGESSDGKRFVGILDNGEKISFPKKSLGWSIYLSDDEAQTAHAV